MCNDAKKRNQTKKKNMCNDATTKTAAIGSQWYTWSIISLISRYAKFIQKRIFLCKYLRHGVAPLILVSRPDRLSRQQYTHFTR